MRNLDCDDRDDVDDYSNNGDGDFCGDGHGDDSDNEGCDQTVNKSMCGKCSGVRYEHKASDLLCILTYVTINSDLHIYIYILYASPPVPDLPFSRFHCSFLLL